jgi:hypothetical protein
MIVWIVVQEVSYPTTGIDGSPQLRIEHSVHEFSGGDCKFGSGYEVVGIFETEFDANVFVADLTARGVILYNPPVPIEAGSVSEEQKPSLRVFLMLAELHRRGYEQLRIVPGMSPSGMHYRCGITPALNVASDHGALAIDTNLVANQTSANGDRLFNWEDAGEASIGELARMFIRRFPHLAKLGRAPDANYARWFDSALEHARRGAFPIAYDDGYFERPNPMPGQRSLPTLGAYDSDLAMPPPGLSTSAVFHGTSPY